MILKCSDDGKTVTVRSKADEMSKDTENSYDKRGDGENVDNDDDEDKEDSVLASDTSGSLHMQHNTITRQVKLHSKHQFIYYHSVVFALLQFVLFHFTG